jgi:AraC-like DNA-binding protein
MKFTDIRQLYTPIQPTVKKSDDKISYSEFLPDASLHNYIYCYWQLKTNEPLATEFNYRAIADGCIDICFELSNPKESFVVGLYEKYSEHQFGRSFNYIGIRFIPSMFPRIFRLNAKELSNKVQNLDSVIPVVSSFIKNSFGYDQSLEEIKNTLDTFFNRLISNSSLNDNSRLDEAIQIILKNYGNIKVIKELNTGFSSRQLQRIFEFNIGDSAKTFTNIVRFQNILRANPTKESLRKDKLFYTAGYYDQSHFIKEFKNFYGLTPTKAFEK